MNVTIERKKRRTTRVWKKGEIFTWRDGLYVVTGVRDRVLNVTVIHTPRSNTTQAGEETIFSPTDSDITLVTELIATVEE